MKQFLRETWELFYWAFFCPSRLQARMNEWSPEAEEDGRRPDTEAIIILLFRANRRFVLQYLFLNLLLSLPLAWLIWQNDWRDGWLWPMTLLIAYAISMRIETIAPGLSWPLFTALSYARQPDVFHEIIASTLSALPPWPKIGIGIAAGSAGLAITLMAGFVLLRSRWHSAARLVLILGAGFSVAGGTWLAAQSWQLTLFTSAFIMYSLDKNLDVSTGLNNVAFVVTAFTVSTVTLMTCVLIGIAVGGVAGFMVGVMVGFGASMVAAVVMSLVRGGVVGLVLGDVVGLVPGGVVGLAVGLAMGLVVGGTIGSVAGLPLPFFLVVCTGIGIVVSFWRGHWVGIIIAGVMTALGISHLGAWAILAIPAVWLGYYRILPLYPLWAALSLLASGAAFWPGRLPDAVRWLHRLPPYPDELVWLPLPRHDRLLAAVFWHNPDVGLDELRKMQASHSPGLRRTARLALPCIVADQLASISDLTMLLNTARVSHSYLPALVPGLYNPGEENFAQPDPAAVEALRREQPEIAQLLPRFQAIARSVAAALDSQSAILRERGLERALNELQLLQGQLPGMNLGPHVMERWRPVLERWQALLQAEVERHHSEASAREIINPFQFGNPLSRERAYLFKGRTAFAEQIVRMVLDRSRPTLVLHGPRRYGKSSFLLNLPRLLPADIVSVYVDLQSAAATESEADFCYSLARAMYRDGQTQGLELPPPRRDDFRASPYPVLEDWLDAALLHLGRRHLLIGLDEFEKLGTALFQGRLSERLLDELRHLIQHYDPLGFLFSGVQTLDELGPHWHSYFISIVPIEMLYLEHDEARKLLTDPHPEFDMEYEEGIVEQIIALTRGQPYLLQLIGASLVKHANLNRTRRINAKLLEDAIASAFREGKSYFTNLWEEYTGTTPAQLEAGRASLIALAQGRPIIASSEDAQAALQRMMRYHIIERTGESYRFEIPLVERWVREYVARGL